MPRYFKRRGAEWAEADKPFGLGDAVAAVAEPIARALDATLGTHTRGCGGCAKRRDALNRIMPDVRSR